MRADHDPDFQVEEDKKPATVVSDDPEIAKINAILDNTIRPGLQMDGGDIQIVSFDGMNLTVNYQGACGSCPSSTMGTLKAIESILRDQYNPEITVQTEGSSMRLAELPRFRRAKQVCLKLTVN